MRHPAESHLALYATGDLGLATRWLTAAHVSRCSRCAREVSVFRNCSEAMRETALELPDDLHWNRLAAEIKANIRLGLDAGEIVGGKLRPTERLTWRAALALAAVTMIILSGWWLHIPQPVVKNAVAGTVVVSTAEGIEIQEGGAAMTLMHPQAGDVTYSADTDGAVRARYIDAQSGQVTINNVYSE